MSGSFLKVSELSKSYYQTDREIPVLKDLSFEMGHGESMAVVGASGVGKSTLLHCLGLLDHVTKGEIRIDGELVSTTSSDKSAKTERTLNRRRHIGFVFQFHYLMAELNALENVAVPLLVQGMERELAIEKAKEWLERVGLSHRLTHKPAELSGGEQQRVAIARALVHEPNIILADEPTGNLDPKTAKHVFDILLEQCKDLKSTLVMATHNLELAGHLSKMNSIEAGALKAA